MPVAALPATSNIVELQLAIALTVPQASRPLNRKRAPAAPLTEIWRGQIALARMTRADTAALAAFLETLDGSVTPFKVLMAGGFASQSLTESGTLTVAAASGATSISVTFAGSVTLPAGTLLAIGDIDTATYQMCELLAPVSGSGVQTLEVAPRIRKAFAAATAVALGSVYAKLVIESPRHGVSGELDRGSATLEVVESLA